MLLFIAFKSTTHLPADKHRRDTVDKQQPFACQCTAFFSDPNHAPEFKFTYGCAEKFDKIDVKFIVEHIQIDSPGGSKSQINCLDHHLLSGEPFFFRHR